jgi:FAD binding domain in molybdopterin dehydrogenase.
MTQTDVVFHRPETIAAALSILSSAAPRPAIPLAGGTWIMRAALRGEDSDKSFVSLANIASLHGIEKRTAG